MNKTTIEYKEKTFGKKSDQMYDNGIFQNFEDVFGKNYFLWFFPIKNEEILEGYSYTINETYLNSNSDVKEETHILNTSNFKKEYSSQFSKDKV